MKARNYAQLRCSRRHPSHGGELTERPGGAAGRCALGDISCCRWSAGASVCAYKRAARALNGSEVRYVRLMRMADRGRRLLSPQPTD